MALQQMGGRVQEEDSAEKKKNIIAGIIALQAVMVVKTSDTLLNNTCHMMHLLESKLLVL